MGDNSEYKGDLDIRRAVPKRMKAALIHKGWRAADLSKATGVSPTAVHNHLHGNVLPNEIVMKLYCIHLNVTTAWLIGRTDVSADNINLDVEDQLLPRWGINSGQSPKYDRLIAEEHAVQIPSRRHTNLRKSPRLSSKNSATVRNPEQSRWWDPVAEMEIDPIVAFSLFEGLPDDVWINTGVWYSAIDLHGEDYRKRKQLYTSMQHVSVENRKALSQAITERCAFLGVVHPAQELARATGIRENHISDVMNCKKNTKFRKEQLFLVAAALRTTPGKLEGRSLLDTSSNSGGVAYRRETPNVDGIIIPPIPIGATFQDRIDHLYKLMPLISKNEPNGGPITQSWYERADLLDIENAIDHEGYTGNLYGEPSRDVEAVFNQMMEDYLEEERLKNLPDDNEIQTPWEGGN